MNISQAARASGVPAKTIRYYESIGLISPAGRSVSGYRVYGDQDVQILRFVARARSLGFAVDDVGHLLALWRDRSRASAEVKALASQQVAMIDQKMAELSAMRAALTDLMTRCHGDDRPDCPILDQLAGSGAEAAAGQGCCEAGSHSSAPGL